VFLSLKLPTGIMVGGVDRVDNYLVVTNSHDGGSSLTAVITPTRVVCANTLSVALAHNVSSIKLRHTTNVKDRMAQARQTLGVTVKYLDEFEAIANSMLATSVTNSEFDRLIKAVWPEKDTSADKSTRGATISANRTAKVTDLFRCAVRRCCSNGGGRPSSPTSS
jgi:phage/plasmid-like protein (TIGR03299 family)